MYQYRARLTVRSNGLHAIYDADTMHITADLGFEINANLGPCRLYGINAPEMRGIEKIAGTAARDWVRERLPYDVWFTILTRKDTTGKYGRYLVEIMRDGDDTTINAQLVAAGHAVYANY